MTAQTNAGLERFIEAQDAHGTYEVARREIQAGNKTSHWMWFVFPQLAELGRSSTAKYYGVADIGEAHDYLVDPVLGPRLKEISRELLAHQGTDLVAILGPIDALKLRSSMTLFEVADSSERVFSAVLDAFCAGERDEKTLALLGR